MDWLEKLLSGNWGSAPAVQGGGANPNYIGSTSDQRRGLLPVDTAMHGMANVSTGSGGGGMFGGLLDNFLSKTDTKTGIKTEGWGGTALGLGQGLFQGYNGMKQFGLAEDQFKESQRQYNQDYAAQVKSVNTQLEDRQRARVASNPNAYESVSTYLDKNRMI